MDTHTDTSINTSKKRKLDNDNEQYDEINQDLISTLRKIYCYHYLYVNTTSDILLYQSSVVDHPYHLGQTIEPHFIRDDGYIIYFRLYQDDKLLLDVSEEIIHLTMHVKQIFYTKVCTFYLSSLAKLNGEVSPANAIEWVDLVSEREYHFDESIYQTYVRLSEGSHKRLKIDPNNSRDTSLPISNQDPIEIFDKSQWISASKTRNYALKDTIIDWLDYWYEPSEVRSPRPLPTNNSDFMGFLMKKGIKFEENVISLIKARVGLQNFVTICGNMDNFYDKIFTYEKETIEHIKKGIPVIYQAVLLNREGPLKYSYGMPDLLVRTDYISKFIANYHTSGANKDKYVVIDIKFCTLDLCADGRNIRNSGSFPAYKCQLYVYTHALGRVQGWEPNISYILGRRYKYTASGKTHVGDNCFSRLGHIDYGTWDSGYKQMTLNALNWIKKIRTEGQQWSLLPEPSVPELYPNMCNTKDNNWNKLKTSYAKQIGEITLLWNCGIKNRIAAHSKGVYSFYDSECTTEVMAVKGSKHIPVISAILQINQKKEFDNVLDRIDICGDISDSTNDLWRKPSNVRITVDFETINSITDDFTILPIADTNSYLYMIGISYYSESTKTTNYRSIVLPRLTKRDELNLIYQFYDLIKSLTNLDELVLFHWGHIERTFFQSTCMKLQKQFPDQSKKLNQIVRDFKWYDMAEVFKNNLIVINGCFKFGLKEVAGRLAELGLIQTRWKEEGNGTSAMIAAYNLYRELHDSDTNIIEHPTMKSIIEYNKVDCLVIHEIIDLLRKKCDIMGGTPVGTTNSCLSQPNNNYIEI